MSLGEPRLYTHSKAQISSWQKATGNTLIISNKPTVTSSIPVWMQNFSYLSLQVDICSLQNQFPYAIYVAMVRCDHQSCCAKLGIKRNRSVPSTDTFSIESGCLQKTMPLLKRWRVFMLVDHRTCLLFSFSWMGDQSSPEQILRQFKTCYHEYFEDEWLAGIKANTLQTCLQS